MESRVHKTERYDDNRTQLQGHGLYLPYRDKQRGREPYYLMPYPITDKCDGFADKEAERVDEEIFFYTSESDLKLPDNELVAILSESNPDWFD